MSKLIKCVQFFVHTKYTSMIEPVLKKAAAHGARGAVFQPNCVLWALINEIGLVVHRKAVKPVSPALSCSV